jgi:hypothetical protein
MDHQFFYRLCMFVGSIPYLAIVIILAYYVVRRAIWKHKRGRGMPGFCPSSAALGMVFLFTLTFYRPSLKHVTEVRQVMDVEDDDQGDPETKARELEGQLKRIRRGEPVESLVFRL